MNDCERAKACLQGHTLVLCKGEKIYVSDGRGISPMLGFIGAGMDLRGFSAADIIVGKAAAMLFAYAGVTSVFAKTLSQGGLAVLKQYGIEYGYEILTEKIINRAGTDVCPMEKSLVGIARPDDAYTVLKETAAKLRAERT